MKAHSILHALALTGVLAIISHASENWTGDGGKGTSITIDAPTSTGLAENQSHLPTVVQAELISNFLDYSAISVLDWEKLGEIYSKLSSGVFGGDSTEAAMQDLGQLAPTTHFMTGRITKSGTSYHLQMTISKTSDKMTVASYSGTFTYWDLDNLTGIRKASLELLKKMGVALTAKAQGELAGAATASYASGQAAFAKGMNAQRQGNEVAALSYYFQAAAFNPSMREAASRSSTLNASIASGSMGDNVRNDIQWRKQWVDRLTETEQFFDNFNKMESMPYTLFYSKDITQGKINYQNETVALSIETYLYGSGVWTVSIERALQAVYDGLNATKRKDVWELGRWPQQGVTNLKAFERRGNNFSVVFELVNNRNKVIGRQALQAGGWWGLNWSGRPRVEISNADRKTLNFQNVKANDITDNLTIRVANVNGTDAETAAINGVLQIKAIKKSEADTYDLFSFSRGEVKGFANRYAENPKDPVIPNTIWGDPVISIGEGAFENSGLTLVVIPYSVASIGEGAFRKNKLNSVTIPSGVTYIGKEAFKNAGLTNVIIPHSVVSISDGAFAENNLSSITIPSSVNNIGEEAFAGNKLRSITIPNSVNNIGEKAFYGNKLSSITIGANVAMAENSFHYSDRYSFEHYYNKNGKKEGTYKLMDEWYSESELKLRKRPIRLGARLSYGKGSTYLVGSRLFDKSYANYGNMKTDMEPENTLIIPGLTLDFKIMDIYFDTDYFAIALATELNYNLAECNSRDVSMSYQTIEVPVLLRSQLDYFYIETGFQVGFPVSSEATVSGSRYSDFKTIDYGPVVGLGFRDWDFGVGVRFTFHLTELDTYGTLKDPFTFSVTLVYDFL